MSDKIIYQEQKKRDMNETFDSKTTPHTEAEQNIKGLLHFI